LQSTVYFSSLIVDIIGRAQALGYSVMTSLIKNFESKQILKFLQNGSVRGAIISGGTTDETEVSGLLDNAFPMVFVDKLFSDKEISGRKSIVNRNNIKGAYLATKYLLEMGHTDIVYINSAPNRLVAIERLQGYKKALQDSGQEVIAENILKGDFSDKTAEKVVADFITKKHLPSAIFAINDMSAIGAIRALKKKNIKIPDEVSVVGFDDLFIASEIEPKLTTVRANTEMIAMEAVERLVKMLENPSIGASKLVIDPVLVERESVKRKGVC
jgi:LacI family transcriptional regulator